MSRFGIMKFVITGNAMKQCNFQNNYGTIA